MTLEDESQFTLNTNSSLRFLYFGFGQGTRQVVLSDEAEFLIRHSLSHQRFVETTSSGVLVTVLVTQFMVFARPRRAQVTLRTEKVSLKLTQMPKAPAIIMKPGDFVEVEPNGKLSRSHTSTPQQFASWKERQIKLDRTSLSEIAATLEETYGF